MVERGEIESRCAKFESSTGISVTVHAQVLLLDLINAVEVDPHPRWSTDIDIPLLSKSLVTELPTLLKRIAEAERVEKKITAYDVFRWGGRKLNDPDYPLACRRGGWERGLPWVLLKRS